MNSSFLKEKNSPPIRITLPALHLNLGQPQTLAERRWKGTFWGKWVTLIWVLSNQLLSWSNCQTHTTSPSLRQAITTRVSLPKPYNCHSTNRITSRHTSVRRCSSTFVKTNFYPSTLTNSTTRIYCNSAVCNLALILRQANINLKNFDPPSVHTCAFTVSLDFNCGGNVSELACYGVKRRKTGFL